MNTKHTNRRALLMSVIAMILCCAMLIGTTMAWFTDAVSSTNNKIVAGNLDVELYYKNDVQKTYDKVATTTNVFKTETLWEPGHVEMVNLKVANEGSLALKYQLGINIASEVGSVNKDGENFKVSDYIKFAVIDGDKTYTREQAVAAAEDANAQPIKTGYNSDATKLEAGQFKEVTVVVYMPEEIENEANHAKDAAQPTITLGLNLSATQVEHESDSFGNDYDKLAPEGNHEIVANGKNYETIQDAIDDGATSIFIGGKHSFTAANAGQNTEMGVSITGTTSDAAIEFVGNGGGISNITLNDLTVIDSTYYTSENGENAWEFTYLEVDGNNYFSNVEFTDGIFVEGGHSEFVNCSFSGHNNDSSEYGNTTMYAAWVYSGSANFSGCKFSGTRGLKVADQYSGSDVTAVTVDDCFFGPLSEKPGLAVDNRLGALKLTIKNSIFAGTQPGDAESDPTKGVAYIYENDNRTPDATTITLENNSVSEMATQDTSLSDLIKNAENGDTIYVAAGNHVMSTLSGKKGITIQGATDGSTTLSGVNSFGFGTDTTIKDVTFEGSNAVRYGYTHGDVVFENVTFKGNTYGFHVDNANDGTITFNNCTFEGFNALASTGTYYFNDCTFLNSGSYGHTNMWGKGTFTNCTFGDGTSVGRGGNYPGTGTVIIDGEDIGYQRDFIGSAKTLRAMKNDVDKNSCKKDQSYVLVDDIDLGGTFWYPIEGSFAGTFDGQGHTISNMDLAHEYVGTTSNVAFFTNVSSTAKIKNVTFDKANVYGEHYVAVILGWEGNETANATIENCHVINSTVTCNTDATPDNGDKAGGICGYAVTLNIKDCTVKNTTIKAYRDFGGILGCAKGSKVNVTGCSVENLNLVIDNDVNYKGYTTDAEHNAGELVGRYA